MEAREIMAYVGSFYHIPQSFKADLLLQLLIFRVPMISDLWEEAVNSMELPRDHPPEQATTDRLLAGLLI